MADDKKPNVFEEFVAETSKLQDLGSTLKQFNEDSRPGVNNAAGEKIKKSAYGYAKEFKLTDLPFEAYAADGEAVQEHIQEYQRTISNNIANKLTGKSLEGLVKGIDTKTLDAVIGSELNPNNERALIKSELLKDHADLFKAYQTKLAIESQVKRFKEGKFEGEDEQKLYVTDAAEGFSKEQEAFFKEKIKGENGYSEKLLNALKDQARKAVLRGHIADEKKLRGYAVKAAEARLSDADKKYKETEKKKGTVYDITRKAIKKTLESKDTDTFNQMASTLYGAYKATK